MLKIFFKLVFIAVTVSGLSISALATDLNIDASTDALEKATEVITVAVDLPESELLEPVDSRSDLPEIPIINQH